MHRQHVIIRWLACLTLAYSLCNGFAQSTPRPPTDEWATNFVQFPTAVSTNAVRLKGFESLHADAIVGKLKVIWQAKPVDTNDTVTLWVSVDEAGHWPARDWRPYPMIARGAGWETAVPVDNVDISHFYFVAAKSKTETQYSLMRVCHPRQAGLEEPSRIFWPFLEGFEEDTLSWSVSTPEGNSSEVKTDPLAKHGNQALLAQVPEGKRSVTVSTTRIRGWQAEQNFANGIRLWVRTREKTGRVRFSLIANAYTEKEVISIFPHEIEVLPKWEVIELPFKEFPRLPLENVDLFTIECIGNGPIDFLLDDVEFTGRWHPSAN